MCLAWPMQITELLPERYGMADLDGVKRRIGLRLLPGVKVGDFVLVHAGYAIELIDADEARARLGVLAELRAVTGNQG